MNTPAHLIFGAAMFAQPDKPKVTAAAIIGGLMPDFSLYFLAGWSIFVLQNDPSFVFNTQYFSDSWQAVFAIDNSFIVWGALIALGLWLKRNWIIAFAVSGFVHIIFDFLLHNDDARQHFWPLSDWVFVSPFSYWDIDHHGGVIGILEVIVVLTLVGVLLRRFRKSKMSVFFVLVGLMEAAPIIMFAGMQ